MPRLWTRFWTYFRELAALVALVALMASTVAVGSPAWARASDRFRIAELDVARLWSGGTFEASCSEVNVANAEYSFKTGEIAAALLEREPIEGTDGEKQAGQLLREWALARPSDSGADASGAGSSEKGEFILIFGEPGPRISIVPPRRLRERWGLSATPLPMQRTSSAQLPMRAVGANTYSVALSNGAAIYLGFEFMTVEATPQLLSKSDLWRLAKITAIDPSGNVIAGSGGAESPAGITADYLCRDR